MKKPNQLLKIGDAAKQLNTTPRTLRFYEEQGLIISHRTEKGTRLYSPDELARLQIILQLAQLGIPIEYIKILALTREQNPTGATASQQVSQRLEQLLQQVMEKKQLYATLEQDIKYAISIIQHCRTCQNAPTRKTCPTCPINDNLEQSPMLRLIWDQVNC